MFSIVSRRHAPAAHHIPCLRHMVYVAESQGITGVRIIAAALWSGM